MRWFWWGRKPVQTEESHKAVEDSCRSVEEAKGRWPLINETAIRAERASAKIRSQRSQNHLGDIVMRAALLGEKKKWQ